MMGKTNAVGAKESGDKLLNEKQRAAMTHMRELKQDDCILTSEEFTAALLPTRKRTAHKGDFGRVLILAGSVGYTGAPALAADAALRGGAGLIFTGVPKAVYPIVAMKLDEPMVFPLPCDRQGRLSARAVPEILRRLERCDACLIGPGLGVSRGVFAVVRAVLQNAKIPVIVDADGINVLEGHIDILGQATCPIVLTPHDGEFQKLGGDSAPDSRICSAKALSERTGATVLLKGHRTLIVGADRMYLNTTGNPGMATGGSGDVLAGLLLALLGQGIALPQAAAAAAWIHGAAGDFCAAATGEYGVTPTDMIANLPQFLK